MGKQTHNSIGQARGSARLALLCGVLLVGVAPADDAANARKGAVEDEAPDKQELASEKPVAPAAPNKSGFFPSQAILDMNNHGVGFGNGVILPRDEKRATLKFDISFNAFRQDLSHNAVWIFFKVRAEGSNEWQHVRLDADQVMNPTSYGCTNGNAAVDLMVPRGEDGFTGPGLFLRLADHHPGLTLAARGVTAVWDFTTCKGITRDTKVEMRAFAIRMMYIPKGSFYLGSGGREMFGFYRYTDGKQDTLPFQVASSNAIPTGKADGRLWSRGSEPADNSEIPATFPTGYAAFYSMENPVDGTPYAAYLNTLTQEQANERFFDKDLVSRQEVKSPGTTTGSGTNYIYAGGNRMKANGIWGLSYLDGALYSAWAGLRPMTELEYEKALRGFRAPMPDEAGYSYWGINFGGGIYNGQPRMRVVGVNEPAGRKFTGTHGQGALALPADWPKEDAVGIITRGGWGAPGVGGVDVFRTSDRHMSDADAERRAGYGWRCVRTAPIEAEWNTARGESPEAFAKSGK
ncbi:MAG: hypothetical protein WCR06_08985 [bacterium]